MELLMPDIPTFGNKFLICFLCDADIKTTYKAREADMRDWPSRILKRNQHPYDDELRTHLVWYISKQDAARWGSLEYSFSDIDLGPA